MSIIGIYWQMKKYRLQFLRENQSHYCRFILWTKNEIFFKNRLPPETLPVKSIFTGWRSIYIHELELKDKIWHIWDSHVFTIHIYWKRYAKIGLLSIINHFRLSKIIGSFLINFFLSNSKLNLLTTVCKFRTIILTDWQILWLIFRGTSKY